MFYALKNLTELDTVECAAPWDFKITAPVSMQIRKDKQERQNWYMNAETVHNFYSPFEGVNKLQRVSKESNPPVGVWGIVADYDTPIAAARIDEAIAAMPIKPSYIETSLGGGTRLVWLFEHIIWLGGYDFAVLFQRNLIKWLNLNQLPQLDEGALCAPSRLYANGGVWRSTGVGPIPEKKFQAFLVKCGLEFNFVSGDAKLVPMDIVEKAIREKYPTFSTWPGEFKAGAQGPTFWIPESRSPNSAIVKEGGMFTFSQNADKLFYSWGDMLGKDFIAGFMEESMSKATAGYHWDGRVYWKQSGPENFFITKDITDVDLHLTVNCNLSQKPDESGKSPYKKALRHIREAGRVESATHFVFYPPGIIIVDKQKHINLYNKTACQPSGRDDLAVWGDAGGFPFHSRLADWLWFPDGEEQKIHHLSWLQIYYISALTFTPTAGQNFIMKGAQGVGKTWWNREVDGYIVGGAIDASGLIVDAGSFNGTYFEWPHWALDDDSTMTGGHRSVTAVFTQLKKYAANDGFTAKQKYLKDVRCRWGGRIGMTVNPDITSAHMISAETDLDKLNMYSCRMEKGDFRFPDRKDMIEIRNREMPHFCQWLLTKFKIPEELRDPERWGVFSYQEKTMLNVAKQASQSSTFKEVLISSMADYFNQHPDRPTWVGPVTELQRIILTFAGNGEILRGLKIEQTNRHMEAIHKEAFLDMSVSTGDRNIRIWTLKRSAFVRDQAAPEPAAPMGEGDFNAPTHKDQ